MTQDLLHELFEYKDGELVWNINKGTAKIGDVAGCLDTQGYIQTSINSKPYRTHRLIYIYHNGDIPKGLQVDHINGIRNDNHIENLRLATHQENQWNRTKAKGYTWNKRNNKWNAQIKVNGKRKHLGLFYNEDDAHQAYLNAKDELHIIERVA